MKLDTTKKTGSKKRAIGTVVGIMLLVMIISGMIHGGLAIILILFALVQFLHAYCFY